MNLYVCLWNVTAYDGCCGVNGLGEKRWEEEGRIKNSFFIIVGGSNNMIEGPYYQNGINFYVIFWGYVLKNYPGYMS